MYDNKVISNNIRVYPCSNRNPESDYMARLTTEYNLVSIINRLVDMKSFCVTTFQGESSTNLSSLSEFMFNINGYLFTIEAGQFKDIVDYLEGQYKNNNDNDTLYACICVGKPSDGHQFIELLPSKETQASSSPATLSGEAVEGGSYLGNMDVKDEGDTYFKGVTFVVGPPVEPGERGHKWEKTLTVNDTGIFGKFTADASGYDIKKFILPIVQVEETTVVDGKRVASTFSVPQDSRVKFATVENGSVRSVTIDDGVLE